MLLYVSGGRQEHLSSIKPSRPDIFVPQCGNETLLGCVRQRRMFQFAKHGEFEEIHVFECSEVLECFVAGIFVLYALRCESLSNVSSTRFSHALSRSIWEISTHRRSAVSGNWIILNIGGGIVLQWWSLHLFQLALVGARDSQIGGARGSWRGLLWRETKVVTSLLHQYM